MENAPLRILGIAGSLRLASHNKGLIRAAVELAPAGVIVEPAEIGGIPLYNADQDEENVPPAVRALKERVRAADAILFATPEYNYSVPGVLKNAIDWLSRGQERVLRQKPVAIMGATTGGFGTARAQLVLRQVFVYTESLALPKPEVLVSFSREKFDADGNLTDAKTREDVRALVQALAAWTRRLRTD